MLNAVDGSEDDLIKVQGYEKEYILDVEVRAKETLISLQKSLNSMSRSENLNPKVKNLNPKMSWKVNNSSSRSVKPALKPAT
jgi:hypothetical protein